MKPVQLIDNLQALRALSDALRMAMIRELRREPQTATQLGTLLGEPVNKLHYHLTELEKHGLVEVVEVRPKGNLLEKYYSAVAEFFRVDPQLFEAGTPEAMAVLAENIDSLLDTARMELRRALQAGRITPREVAASFRCLLQLRLAPEEIAEFRQRLEALVSEYRERSRPEAGAGLGLTVLLFPLAGEGEAPDRK